MAAVPFVWTDVTCQCQEAHLCRWLMVVLPGLTGSLAWPARGGKWETSPVATVVFGILDGTIFGILEPSWTAMHPSRLSGLTLPLALAKGVPAGVTARIRTRRCQVARAALNCPQAIESLQ